MKNIIQKREYEKNQAIIYIRKYILSEYKEEGQRICMNLYFGGYSEDNVIEALEYLGICEYELIKTLNMHIEGEVNKRILNIKTNKGRIFNYTPHDVNILSVVDMKPVKTYKSKGIARVSTKSKYVDTVNGVDIYKTEYGKVEGLPKEKEGVYYIVSMLVKQACPTRKDLFSPSQLKRNEKGQIIGCLGLE